MRFAASLAAALLLASTSALAGPETALREFAGGQVKKGVRTIGMGGDGATTGNYALVYRDAGGAIFDEGVAHFLDTGNTFTFSAVGFTTPTFWKDAAFYVIALGQTGNGVRVWDYTKPDPSKPPSRGNLSDTSVFIKFAKPITKTLSFGLMGAFETSQATLFPDQGGAAIQYGTSYLPSGGLGLHWQPDEHWQAGARVILNHDMETRTQGSSTTSGLLRSYEYRLGVAYSPWRGTLFDAGIVGLDRSNQVEHTLSFALEPTVGVEQALVRKRVWVRAGLDETTWTTGMSVKVGPFKLDLAYLYNLAAARTGDMFGRRNASLIGTLGFDYASLFSRR
ncbi:MAG TPA: hypothetical protein VLM85_23030 [Polyangiaceae bacterium]|nr:hypothetical protein [Polyangiaceae bacterium]